MTLPPPLSAEVPDPAGGDLCPYGRSSVHCQTAPYPAEAEPGEAHGLFGHQLFAGLINLFHWKFSRSDTTIPIRCVAWGDCTILGQTEVTGGDPGCPS